MIKSSERYLSLLYDRMHQQIYQGPVIHADETPSQSQERRQEYDVQQLSVY